MRANTLNDFITGALFEFGFSSYFNSRCAEDFVRRGEKIPQKFMPGDYLKRWKAKNPDNASALQTVTEKDFQDRLSVYHPVYYVHPALNRHLKVFVMRRNNRPC